MTGRGGFFSVLALAATLGIGGAFAASPAFVLEAPLRCVDADDCAIVKYMDHAAGAEIRDYACGDMTGGENDYPATSIAIRDLKRMRDGVPVLAAAAGTVLRIRDGVADTGIFGAESRQELSAKGCGNAVVLSHGDDWTTAYCHLRNGSLAVKPGDVVPVGGKIAEVGLSGLTELPHLHFQVRWRDRPVDPFTGPAPKAGHCGLAPERLWSASALKLLGPYRPLVIRAAGFAAEEPTLGKAREGAYGGALAACPASLRLWAEIIGLKQGDRITLRIDDPSGAPRSLQTITAERNFAQTFSHIGLSRPKAAGRYRGLIEVWRGAQRFSREATVMIDGSC